MTTSIQRIAAQHLFARAVTAAPLQDVSKLRYQAVFMMGAGGSGKGYVAHRWLKYMPHGPSTGYTSRPEWDEKVKEAASEAERGLTNINFERAVQTLAQRGFKIKLVDPSHAEIPFVLYEYDRHGVARKLDPEHWSEELPPKIYQEVQGLTKLVFSNPVHEVPSFWRQVNPDLYKEEIAGYSKKQPGYVHEMSSTMSKAYFEAVVETGDPIFVDGTGSDVARMKQQFQTARAAGYNISLVFVYVPLTINHIRNATRDRVVTPSEVTSQWKRMKQNYAILRKEADKAMLVDNRNDPVDFRKFKAQGAEINATIAKGSDGDYSDLYSLIKDHAPEELRSYGTLLQGGAVSKSPIELLREKLNVTRHYASPKPPQ